MDGCRQTTVKQLYDGTFTTMCPTSQVNMATRKATGTEEHHVKQKQVEWTEDVNSGTLSANKAASAFQITRRTLWNHLKTVSFVRTLGRQTYLSATKKMNFVNELFVWMISGCLSLLNFYDEPY
ncbi:hypothetical protein PR048_023336 [Dryococelus australis]|uniref:HTH psq-type domain-containing protein n=1 Tax=Dryococelus australis TaxID=614101 RepID=A0ABQ9GTT6_9NEOP|nr:hypothetical protein PR048_023336 [Dryococelus australis]